MTQPAQRPADTYLHRYIDDELDALLPDLSAIAIDGPKGVGKTATASRRTDAILALDDPAIRSLVAADPQFHLSRADTVLIDEWQHLPEIWDAVRRAVDARSERTYLLTGSASPQTGGDTHSGAGRIVSLRMRPLSLAERPTTDPSVRITDLFEPGSTIRGHTEFTLADYAAEICGSGLPDVRALPPRARRAALAGYVDRIIDRDIPAEGISVRRPASLRAWLSAYARATSTTTDYTKILDAATPGDSSKPSKATALSYRDILTKLWILDPVHAWLPGFSQMTRLTQASKHHLADPALVTTLLNISESSLLSGADGAAELFGRLFESLATLTIRAAGAAAEARVFHLRTRGGTREVDLVLERYDGSVVAFEVKLARTVDDGDVRHLHWLGEQIGPRLRSKVVLTTGSDAYRRPDGVCVVPLALLG
ncbi:ATP-binding protein [Brachybacterium sp. GCM10030267]|uniref:ATP-binding protein n=1 Tax=Brachybacterium sp. GCM10030267 TaxID=3273381 RepID=UPI003615E857